MQCCAQMPLTLIVSRQRDVWQVVYREAPPKLVVFLILPLFVLLPFQTDRFSRTRLCNSNELTGTKQPSMHYCV